MNLFGLASSAVSIVVSTGAGAVVGNVIKMTTPASQTLIQKVAAGVGAVVVSHMVGDAASKYASTQLETAATQLKTIKALIRQKQN